MASTYQIPQAQRETSTPSSGVPDSTNLLERRRQRNVHEDRRASCWRRVPRVARVLAQTAEDSTDNQYDVRYCESTITREYAIALCKLFTQFGVRGTSVLSASGDHGFGHGDCKDASRRVHFDAVFPASCTRSGLSLLYTDTDTRRSSYRSPFRRSRGHQCRGYE